MGDFVEPASAGSAANASGVVPNGAESPAGSVAGEPQGSALPAPSMGPQSSPQQDVPHPAQAQSPRNVPSDAQRDLQSREQAVESRAEPTTHGSDAQASERSAEPVLEPTHSGTSSPKLKLKLGPATPNDSPANRFSQRRSERLRNQALKAEETRRVREERAAIEEARARARSIAAKKAAATKRNAAKKEALKAAEIKIAPKGKHKDAGSGTARGSNGLAATAGAAGKDSGANGGGRVSKRVPKHIVKLRYFNPAVPPTFAPVRLGSTALPVFWLRANLREFLYRFDKLCRLPARLTSGLNDPLEPWTPEQFKAVVVAMLKLIANDAKPLHAEVRRYLAEIEALEPTNPQIWDWLLEFVEQLDAYAPQGVPTTEEEQLDLLRRLLVICTGTETIRITVMSDVEQLKWVEKEAQDEMKAIAAKLKDTEQKLAKLKTVDKDVYAEKLAAAQRSAQNKVWRAQQQLFTKTHKFNMRTAPVAQDPHGNMYWSLQYKSAAQSAWGSWVLCEMRSRPTELAAWYQKLSSDVTAVLRSRDLMVAEKNEERRRLRKEKQDSQAPQNPDERAHDETAVGLDAEVIASSPAPALADDDVKPELVKPELDADTKQQKRQQKRRYPKLKINRPEQLAEPELYIVEGRENIRQLAAWIGGFAGVDKKAVAEIEAVATYLAQDE